MACLCAKWVHLLPKATNGGYGHAPGRAIARDWLFCGKKLRWGQCIHWPSIQMLCEFSWAECSHLNRVFLPVCRLAEVNAKLAAYQRLFFKGSTNITARQIELLSDREFHPLRLFLFETDLIGISCHYQPTQNALISNKTLTLKLFVN